MSISLLTANLDPVTAIVRWPSREAELWVKNFLETACIDVSVLAVVAFGSAIRNVHHSADVDLLVVCRNVGHSFAGKPIDVDIRVFQQDELDQKIKDNNDLLSWIIHFGKVLCEKDHFWTDFRKHSLTKLSLPSAVVAKERAARSERLRQHLLSIGDEEAANEQQIVVLTQLARSFLIRHGIYPASRPELPGQLAMLGERTISEHLAALLLNRAHETPNE